MRLFDKTRMNNTEDFFGLDGCRIIAMCGIRNMKSYKYEYAYKVNKELEKSSKVDLFYLWDYRHKLVKSEYGTYLIVSNDTIKPEYHQAYKLGGTKYKFELTHVIDLAESLYFDLVDIEFESKFIEKMVVLINSTEVVVESVCRIKLHIYEFSEKDAFSVRAHRVGPYGFSDPNISFWLDSGFYEPIDLDHRVGTNCVKNIKFDRWNQWWKFESKDTKSKRMIVEIVREKFKK